MALIQCPECGKEISDKAKNCPNCGVPIIGEADIKLKTNHGHRKILVFTLLMFILIVGALGGLFFYNSKRVDLVAKSVVKVHCYDEDGEEIATGSGFIAYDRETIITNYHVLAAGITMSIETESGASFNVVNLRGYSEEDDIAILGLDGDTGLKPLKFDDSHPKKGDKIYAIGSPQGIKNTISDGLVSSIYEDENGNLDVIQISAPISQGSSGGVLLNSACKVIGVTSAGYTDYAYQNINFAIPVRKVEELYKEKTDISLEKLVNDIHKNDHICYLADVDRSEVMLINEVFNYCPGIEGQEVVLCGYYSSEGNGFGGYKVMYLYSDISDVTGDVKTDEKLNDTANQTYYYNKEYGALPVQYVSEDIIYHDDSKFEPGDLVIIYGKTEDREVYGFDYNFDSGEATVEKLKKKLDTKYFDYYSYGLIAKEIECVK